MTLLSRPALARSALAATAVGALLLAASGPTLASGLSQSSDQGAQSVQGQSAQAQAAPSDAQLKSFAAATLAVERLNQEWAGRIQAAENAERKQQLRTEAMQQMAAAVRDEGLTVDEYNAIVDVVQSDESAAATVTEYRDQMGR